MTHGIQAKSRTLWIADALLLAWVALLGADRIDFAGGNATFTLTPFLVLTPFVGLGELIRRFSTGSRIEVGRSFRIYLVLALLLLAAVGASVFVSPSTVLSAERTALLALQIFGSATIVLLASDRGLVSAPMINGACAGLVLFVVFNVGQVLSFLGRIPDDLLIGPVTVHLITSVYAGVIPRLAGVAFDPNRSGLLILFYLALLWIDTTHRSRRIIWTLVALLLLAATLSRSAILATLIAVAFAMLIRRHVRVNLWSGLIGGLLVGLTALLLLVQPEWRGDIVRNTVPVQQRLSLEEGSSQSHLSLLRRGLADATSSVPTMLIGRGFGSSYVFLQDLFPGSRYGNYHSLYVSMFAESGIAALLLTIAMILVPLARAGPFRALIAGVAVFNVFYQLTTEPVFWTMLALAWCNLKSSVVEHFAVGEP